MATDHSMITKINEDDYALLEAEHERLNQYLLDLEDTCAHLSGLRDCGLCDPEIASACAGRMPSFLHDLLDMTEKHFFHEEAIMIEMLNHDNNNEHLRAHRRAHMQILQATHQLIGEANTLNRQGETAQAYRLLFTTMTKLLNEHTSIFDMPFVEAYI
ncbi:MAG TPA: hemerythrin domain-containing protein [Methylophilaceae bacterium]